jgi:hypothetical protein
MTSDDSGGGDAGTGPGRAAMRLFYLAALLAAIAVVAALSTL